MNRKPLGFNLDDDIAYFEKEGCSHKEAWDKAMDIWRQEVRTQDAMYRSEFMKEIQTWPKWKLKLYKWKLLFEIHVIDPIRLYKNLRRVKNGTNNKTQSM